MNNLDVKVEKNDLTHYPWRLTDVHLNANDDENNVDPFERVDIENASGTYTVTISHKGVLKNQKQDYALIITGVEGETETCETPENLVVDEIEPNTFHVSWDVSSESFSSEWLLVEETESPDIENPLDSGSLESSEDSFYLTDLNSTSTSYLLYIRKVCDEEDEGNWLIFPFQTNCEIIEAPYFQNFNSEDFEIPICWHKNTLSEGWKVADTVSSSYGEFYQESILIEDSIAYVEPQPYHQKPYILTTPKFDISELEMPVIKFDYFQNKDSETSTTDFEVEIWNGSSWELVFFASNTDLGFFQVWDKAEIDLNDYESLDYIKARFKVQQSTGDFSNIIAIKNVSITDSSACPKPHSISTETINSNSVEVSFLGNELATEGYNWVLIEQSNNFNNESSWVDFGELDFNEINFSINNLEVAKDYSLMITSKCEDEEQSDGTIYLFSTECSTFIAPYTQNFDTEQNNVNPTCWNQNLSPVEWRFLFPSSSHNIPHPISGEEKIAILNFNTNPNNQIGELPELISPIIDVSELEIPILQFFVHNYKGNNEVSNSLRVELKDAYTEDWIEIYHDDEGDLDTWKEVKIPLVNHLSSDEVQVRFIGNNTQVNRRIGINDISFIEGPNCFKPYDLNIDNITATEVNFSWASNSNLNIEYEWVILEKNLGNIQDDNTWIDYGIVPANQLDAASNLLIPSSFYTLYIRSICEDDQESEWINIDFLTDCDAFDAPYFQDFNESASEAIEFPLCWEQNELSDGEWRIFEPGGSPPNFDNQIANSPIGEYGYPYVTGNVLSQKADDITLISPVIDISQHEQVYLQFQLFHFNPMNSLNHNLLEVEIFDGINWNEVYTNAEHNKGIWQLITIELDEVDYDNLIQVKFNVDNIMSSTNIAINNFHITSCPQPKEPVITYKNWESVEFEWEGFSNNNEDFEWVIVEENGDVLDEDQWIEFGETNSANPQVNVNNLMENTDYRIYVRSKCDDETSSAWSYSLFSTDCTFFTAPYTQNFDANQEVPDCWNASKTRNLFVPAWQVTDGNQFNDNTTGEGNYITPNNIGNTNIELSDRFLETPFVDITVLENPSLEFFVIKPYYNQEEQGASDITVEFWNGSEWLLVYEDTANDIQEWNQINIELDNYEINGPVKARFNVNIANFENVWTLGFDDISFKESPDCYTPYELEILSSSSTEVEFVWSNFLSSTAYTWYIFEKGVSFDEDESLLSGTTSENQAIASDFSISGIYEYEVYVKSNCDDDLSQVSLPQEFRLEVCEPENQCEFTIELFTYDYSSIGWNGNSIGIYQDGEFITTIGDNFLDGNYKEESFFLCDGFDYEIRSNSSPSSTNSMVFSIYHNNGTLLYHHALGTGLNEEGIFYESPLTDCNDCLIPTDFNLVDVGLNNVKFEWEPILNPASENAYQVSIYNVDDNPETDEA